MKQVALYCGKENSSTRFQVSEPDFLIYSVLTENMTLEQKNAQSGLISGLCICLVQLLGGLDGSADHITSL